MKILFVCTGNTCRSPMAEGILRELAKTEDLNIEANSAGIFAMDGIPASSNAIRALEKIDIDISSHRAQKIRKDLVEDANIILAMSEGHKNSLVMAYPAIEDKIFLLNEYAFSRDVDIDDPFGMNLNSYEQARDEIYMAIKRIIGKLKG